MNICYFTISSFHYTGITTMLVNSFLKNIEHSKIKILCLNDLKETIVDNRVSYINCQDKISESLKDVQKNIQNIINSRSAFLLKSCIIDYIDDDTDVIVYIDSDSLVFDDINSFISQKLNSTDDKLFISSDHVKPYLATNNLYDINTGFWFCNINKYPIKTLCAEWQEGVLRVYRNPEESRKNKILWKYVDQPVLGSILRTQLFSHTILDPNIISIKYKRDSSILCHYFSRYINRMTEDYRKYFCTSIIDPQSSLSIS